MRDWKITNSETSYNVHDTVTFMLSLGTSPRAINYEVTNEETDEVKHVTAYNEEQLGEKIKRGDFND